MKIEGPLIVSVLDDDIQNKRTLEIDFTEQYKQLTTEQQTADMKKYIQQLFQNAEALPEKDSNRQGLLLIMQICEELLPFIQQQELDLDETITMELAAQTATPEISVSLADFKMN
jgi:1-aminocyclopropane-1-carboxylate deaminase/D-cysteine desulfhydrase-like pyridoxal-dependent ACC family enzyme